MAIVYNTKKPVSILWIPDCQVKPGVDLDFLHCIGQYIILKKPDIIINAGDFADMESLSSYDKGRRSFEGRRYKHDIGSAKFGMELLLGPTREYNIKNQDSMYVPKMYMLMGNHEDRINRATDLDPMLDGTISTDDLEYAYYGWDVIPFLEVLVVNQIAFSHYFATGNMGRPAGTASAQLNKVHMSCVSGHAQGTSTANGKRADGRLLTSIIAGSSYTHQEKYLNAQSNSHWRGIIMLHNAFDGGFDETRIPTNYLITQYSHGKVMYKGKQT